MDAFTLLAIGIVVLGVVLTIQFRRQNNAQSVRKIVDYLHIKPSDFSDQRRTRTAQADLVEEAMSDKEVEMIVRGIRAVKALADSGAITLKERDGVVELLEKIKPRPGQRLVSPPELPQLVIDTADDWPAQRAQGGWEAFLEDWQEFVEHLRVTYPAARRHILN